MAVFVGIESLSMPRILRPPPAAPIVDVSSLWEDDGDGILWPRRLSITSRPCKTLFAAKLCCTADRVIPTYDVIVTFSGRRVVRYNV